MLYVSSLMHVSVDTPDAFTRTRKCAVWWRIFPLCSLWPTFWLRCCYGVKYRNSRTHLRWMCRLVLLQCSRWDVSRTVFRWPFDSEQQLCSTSSSAATLFSWLRPFWTAHPSRVDLNEVIPLSFFSPLECSCSFCSSCSFGAATVIYFVDSAWSRAAVHHYFSFPIDLSVNLWPVTLYFLPPLEDAISVIVLWFQNGCMGDICL